MVEERGVDVGRKKEDEEKISDDETDHEEAIDPVDSLSSEIDKEAEEEEERKRA